MPARCLADSLVAWAPCYKRGEKDGYCMDHWKEIFKGMTSSQRMVEKRHLKKIIEQKKLA